MTSASVKPLPILYSFRRCPYAMRARMGLLLMQRQVELREVVLKDKPESLLSYSPKGTVPVLVLPNGQVIEQSLEIIDWAVATNDTPLKPPSSIEAQLIATNDNEFKSALDRYKYYDRFPEHNQQYYRDQGLVFLSQLEQQLSGQLYLYGDEISYSDIAIFPFVRQFAHVDLAWFEQVDYPQLKRWLSSLLTSQHFMTTMTKFKQWQPDSPVVSFGATSEELL
ncbi:MAG: glutathione S-transferase [Gammaproteobacteria bacterium]|nr:glutathione S-transferase [Gammaproteobacteria bacterium]